MSPSPPALLGFATRAHSVGKADDILSRSPSQAVIYRINTSPFPSSVIIATFSQWYPPVAGNVSAGVPGLPPFFVPVPSSDVKTSLVATIPFQGSLQYLCDQFAHRYVEFAELEEKYI